MTLHEFSDEQLDGLLADAQPVHVRDQLTRSATEHLLARAPESTVQRRRTFLWAGILGGALALGGTAAALPSIFDSFGRIDYQSSQEYTVDGRGPFRCDFAFRVDPPVDGSTLEDANGRVVPSFEQVVEFIRTHDWDFDDRPVDLVTPAEQAAPGRGDLGVMSAFISEQWRAEVESSLPGWMASVGEIDEMGQCLATSDGSAP